MGWGRRKRIRAKNNSGAGGKGEGARGEGEGRKEAAKEESNQQTTRPKPCAFQFADILSVVHVNSENENNSPPHNATYASDLE